jgi:hypothetical protein
MPDGNCTLAMGKLWHEICSRLAVDLGRPRPSVRDRWPLVFEPAQVVEKVQMLFQGKLASPIDRLDLFVCRPPRAPLPAKGIVSLFQRRD